MPCRRLSDGISHAPRLSEAPKLCRLAALNPEVPKEAVVTARSRIWVVAWRSLRSLNPVHRHLSSCVSAAAQAWAGGAPFPSPLLRGIPMRSSSTCAQAFPAALTAGC